MDGTAVTTFIHIAHRAFPSPGEADPSQVLEILGGRDGSRMPFLLDSTQEFGEAGRFAFLGIDPALRYSYSASTGGLLQRPGGTERLDGPPFRQLRLLLSLTAWKGSREAALREIPFIGGWVGAFSYDLARAVERLPDTVEHDLDLPDLHLAFYSEILVYDYAHKRWTACALLREGEREDSAAGRLDRLAAAVQNAGQALLPALAGAGEPESAFTRPKYEAAVARAIEYIRAGDIFQVNLSQRFDLAPPADLYALFQRLRRASPAPFSAYLAFGTKAILSASPERFLRVEGRRVETRPIKGTRPRGRTPAEDAALCQALLDSEKERAELHMIVDLLRNDLGRVCDYGSVRVREARRLEAYETVFHTVAIIEGCLHPKHDLADLLRACWPGGSITGAPKVRAMEIIDELEPTARAFYTGSIGYIGVDGSMDLSIAIRTLLWDGRRLSYQVGGGIVADSDPAAEYEETLCKAAGLLRALRPAEAAAVGEGRTA